MRYPFDGDLNEHGSAASVSAEPSLPTATVLSTSSSALNQLWELVQWTVVAGTIDLNADSMRAVRCDSTLCCTRLQRKLLLPMLPLLPERRLISLRCVLSIWSREADSRQDALDKIWR